MIKNRFETLKKNLKFIYFGIKIIEKKFWIKLKFIYFGEKIIENT